MAVEAKIEITASTTRLPAGLRAAMKQVQGFVAATTGMFAKQKKDVDERSIARGAAFGGIASNLALRGIDMMVSQGKEVMTFERELMRLGIASRISGGALRNVADAAREISNATGKSALEVLRGGRAYSDLAGAQNFSIDMMRVQARASQATDAATTDLAGTMFQLNESMGIKDAKQMEQVLGGLANQAKDGAIEFAQMSREFGGMMPLFKRFGQTGTEGTMRLGAMYQVVRKGANSAAEAATMMQRILGGIPSHASKFQKYGGFSVFNVDKNGKKTLKDFQEIQALVMKSELVKDPEKFKKSLGRTEGWQGFTLLIEQLQEVERLYNLGMSGGNTIAEDLATATSSASVRIDLAIERIKNEFGALLTPERIDQFVAGIEQMAAAMGPLLTVTLAIADAFGWYLRQARKVGSGVRRGHQWLKDEDYEFLEKHQPSAGPFGGIWKLPGFHREMSAGAAKVSPGEQGRLDRIAREDELGSQLEAAEKDHDPTVESVKIALRAARNSLDANQRGKEMMPEQITTTNTVEDLAVTYLKGGHIPIGLYKEAQAQILGEEQKRAMSAFGSSPLGKALTGSYEPPTYGFGALPSASAGENNRTEISTAQVFERALDSAIGGKLDRIANLIENRGRTPGALEWMPGPVDPRRRP